MIDRLFTLTLTLAVLLGSTLAIGSDLLTPASAHATQASAVTVLPRVVVTGRIAPATTVATTDNTSGQFVQ